MQSGSRNIAHPLRKLTSLFVAWKVLLLLVAACSPGVGYDSSTRLTVPGHHHHHGEGEQLPLVLRHLVAKLTRWDGIYFVTVARRGYLFEQEWAFGWGFTKLIAFCTTGLVNLGIARYEGLEGLVAIVIAHIAHLFSVLLLFKLTRALFDRASNGFIFTAAVLHIISPAGIFLSAPFTESSCSFLTFAGCLNFAKGFARDGKSTARHDFLILLSGIMFGAATTFRSNAILNGLLLLEEAFRVLFRLREGFNVAVVRRLIATGLGGLCVAAGFFLPQYVAYREYCADSSKEVRPWCSRAIPSIYTFVQDHYWNVGLFRYWTLSNVPLFLLAAPMLVILTTSGLGSLQSDQMPDSADESGRDSIKNRSEASTTGTSQILRNLGVSQLLLVVITATTAHVQIITRISSAYPVWIWYVAGLSQKGDARLFKNIVHFMVVYAVVQGGLFASFLPPA